MTRLRKCGFTLVELLVVIAIIAVLLTMLTPALNSARKQAKATVCISQLKHWGDIMNMYTQSNDDYYPYDYPYMYSVNENGIWMDQLASFYGDVGDFRTCPMATKKSPNGVGGRFHQWGPMGEYPGLMVWGFREWDYGSYGTNHWINRLPPGNLGWTGIRADLKLYWRKVPEKNASEVPIFGDCSWYGGMPKNHDTSYGFAPTSADWIEENDFLYPGTFNMVRFCLDRHNKAMNMAFADSSVRRVPLEELWTLRWHRGSTPNYDVVLDWLD